MSGDFGRVFGRAASVVAVVLVSTLPVGVFSVGASGATDAAASTASYTTVDVPGASGTSVTGVNTNGVIAGYFSDASGRHGFIDTAGQIVTVDVPGSTDTRLTSINDAGTVTGAYYTDYGVVEHSFLRTASGTFTWLDDPATPTGGQWDQWGTEARGINVNGVVVGVFYSTDLDGFTYPDDSVGSITNYYGFIWKNGQFTTYAYPNATMNLPGAGTWLDGINKAGTMAGSVTLVESPTVFGEAGLVVNGTTATTFRDVSLTDGAYDYSWCDYTRSAAINDLGTVVGVAGNGCAGVQHAFVRVGSQYSYPTYPGAVSTNLASINNSGVIGGTWSDGTTDHGFVMTTPSATVSGTVSASGSYYPGTRFGVRACPGDAAFSAGCAGGALVLADSAGRYSLSLAAGTWNIAGFAWPANSPGQEVASAVWNTTLSQGQAVKQSFQVSFPNGAISGSVKSDWAVPPGTVFAAQACPGTPASFSLSCSSGVTSYADSSGRYTLTLPTGVWSVAGVAWAPWNSGVLGSAVQQVTVAVNKTANASFTVNSPFGMVNGGVTTTGPVPPGTTYRAIACPTATITDLSCGPVVAADSAGRFSLVLSPGFWYVAGVVVPPGGGTPLIGSPTVAAVNWHMGSSVALPAVSTPWGSVVVSVTTTGAWPTGTVFGSYACRPGTTCNPPTSPDVTVNAKGKATLVLLSGPWNIWGVAWMPGRAPLSVAGALVGVTASGNVTSSVTLTSPFAAVTGTITAGAPFPTGTNFFAVACSTAETYSLGCSTAVYAPVDSHGSYTLAIPPGQWNVAAVAYVPNRNPVVGTPVTVTAVVGSPQTLNATVKAPTYLQISAPLYVGQSTTVQVTAKLLGIISNAVAGVPVQLTLGTASCTATTSRYGDAVCTLPTGSARSTSIVATFAGNAAYYGSTAQAPITIR